MSQVLEYGVPVLRSLGIIVLAVTAFFIYEGYRDFRRYPMMRGEKFIWAKAQVDGAEFRWGRTLLLACLLVLGLVLAYAVTLWARGYTHTPGAMTGLQILVWFFTIFIASLFVNVGYAQFLNVSSLIGYWLAWRLTGAGEVNISTSKVTGVDNFRVQPYAQHCVKNTQRTVEVQSLRTEDQDKE